MNYPRAFPLALALLFTTALPLLLCAEPQPTTGAILGRVVDEAGTALANATVKATLHIDPKDPPKKGGAPAATSTTAPALAATTDASGHFQILAVIPGKYDVLAQSSDKKLGGKADRTVLVVRGASVDTGPITLKPRS